MIMSKSFQNVTQNMEQILMPDLAELTKLAQRTVVDNLKIFLENQILFLDDNEGIRKTAYKLSDLIIRGVQNEINQI